MVLVVDSEKGGVGKSALAAGLLAILSSADKRVLAVDLDPRATLTDELDAKDSEFTVNDLLFADPDKPVVAVKGLAAEAAHPAGGGWNSDVVHVLAAERALAHRESDNTAHLESRLRLALTGVAAGGPMLPAQGQQIEHEVVTRLVPGNPGCIGTAGVPALQCGFPHD